VFGQVLVKLYSGLLELAQQDFVTPLEGIDRSLGTSTTSQGCFITIQIAIQASRQLDHHQRKSQAFSMSVTQVSNTPNQLLPLRAAHALQG
jgi:hypothetical protein